MDEIEYRKKRAERGWIAETPPAPATLDRRGNDTKWYVMMGARRLLEEKVERDRTLAEDLAARYADLREKDRTYFTEEPGSSD